MVSEKPLSFGRSFEWKRRRDSSSLRSSRLPVFCLGRREPLCISSRWSHTILCQHHFSIQRGCQTEKRSFYCRSVTQTRLLPFVGFSTDSDLCVTPVRAFDAPHDLTQPRGKQYWRAKSESIFYTPSTGIWQPVWIEGEYIWACLCPQSLRPSRSYSFPFHFHFDTQSSLELESLTLILFQTSTKELWA